MNFLKHITLLLSALLLSYLILGCHHTKSIRDSKEIKDFQLILKKLSRDEYEDVRCAVASNSYMPLEILDKLSRDMHHHVRTAVGANPNTPLKILDKLSEDGDPRVRYRVALNEFK